MIEPFDEKRAEALLQTMPIQPVTNDSRTHRLTVRNDLTAALCADQAAVLCTNDWRLVNCPDCRQAGEATSS